MEASSKRARFLSLNDLLPEDKDVETSQFSELQQFVTYYQPKSLDDLHQPELFNDFQQGSGSFMRPELFPSFGDQLSYPLTTQLDSEAFSSRILDYLRSGYVPEKAAEVLEIDAFLLNGESELDKYDEEIIRMHDAFDDVQVALQELKRARNKLRRALDNARSLISPIRKLPAELLLHIFALRIAEDGYSYNAEFHRNVNAPPNCPTLVLSRTCSFWRKLVWDRPGFWSSLSITFLECKHFWPNEFEFAFHILVLYIERSADAPLKLCLKVQDFDPLANGLFLRLFRVSERWKQVSLTIDLFEGIEIPPSSDFNSGFGFGPSSQPSTTSSLQPRFPILERLDYRAETEPADDNPLRLLSCSSLQIYNAPLSVMTWSDFRRCDFSILKRLVVTGFEQSPLRRFLFDMPLLEEFSFEWIDEDIELEDDDDEDYNDAALLPYRPKISKLSISKHCLEPEIWQSLELPHLVDLEFSADDMPWSSVFALQMSSFPETLRRWDCTIQTLKLHLCGLGVESVIEFVTATPSITHLEIIVPLEEYAYKSRRLFQRLTYMEDRRCLAPNLRSLSVEVTGEAGIGWQSDWTEEICRLVESRVSFSSGSAPDCRFQGLSLRTNSPQIEDTIRYVQRRVAAILGRAL